MRSIGIFLTMLILSHFTVYAQTDKSEKLNNTDDSGVAIQGYDPVSYFIEGPEKGRKNLTYSFKGVIYQFSSEQNLNRFISSPQKFVPVYGGWCAYAMGLNGDKVSIDPKTYKIIDNRLYLFYNKFFNNTLEDWNKDESNLKTKADKNWTKYQSKSLK